MEYEGNWFAVRTGNYWNKADAGRYGSKVLQPAVSDEWSDYGYEWFTKIKKPEKKESELEIVVNT